MHSKLLRRLKIDWNHLGRALATVADLILRALVIVLLCSFVLMAVEDAYYLALLEGVLKKLKSRITASLWYSPSSNITYTLLSCASRSLCCINVIHFQDTLLTGHLSLIGHLSLFKISHPWISRSPLIWTHSLPATHHSLLVFLPTD